jgi:hypothetical protein
MYTLSRNKWVGFLVTNSSIQGKWVGLKYIVYNFQQQQQNGNKTTTAVRLQSWFDANNDGK